MPYRDEFPDFGDMDVAIPEGFKDLSWHNDTCPSFGYLLPGFAQNDERYLIVFIDYADEAKREFEGVARFMAYVQDNVGMPSDVQFSSDDWHAVVNWMTEEIAKHQPH